MSTTTHIAAPKNWQQLPRNELSALFGDMSEVEFNTVTTDMANVGFRGRGVLVWNGSVLDGWHQLRGAVETKCLPIFEKFEGTEQEAFEEAWRRNGARRHYNESQRAIIAARVAQRHSGRPGNPANLRDIKNLPTAPEAAKLLNVSERSIETARKVLAEGTPTLQAAVANGTIAVSDAAKIVEELGRVQNQAVKDVVNGVAPTAAAAVNSRKVYLCKRCTRIGAPSCDKCKAKKSPVPNPKYLVQDEPEKPDDETPWVDEWGIPITKEAEKAFTAQDLFEDLLKKLRECKKLYKALADHPGGAYLTRPGISMNSSDSWRHAGLETCILNVKDCRPTYTVCPYAFNAHHKHAKDCTLCHGLGWVCALGKEEVPVELVKAAKKAHGVQS